MAKRKLKKKFKVTFLLIIIIITSIIVVPKVCEYLTKSNREVNIKKVVSNKINKEKEYTINLIAGGDGLVHNAVRYSAMTDDGSFDFTSQFSLIKDILSNYDLKYYNQESIIDGTEDYLDGATGLYFNTPTAFGDATVSYAGFNLISLANNHSMDTGAEGAYGTVNYWKQMKQNNKIVFAGMNDSDEMKNDYSKNINSMNNITYGFLSYTTSVNGNALPEDYLVDMYSEERVRTDIEAIRDKVDVLIVAMHWGVEYITEPNEQEKKIANYLNELGVDIIIGNHAHCIQPIDVIENEINGNKTVVFYALGNLISNQGLLTYSYPENYGQKVMIGALGTLTITKKIDKDDNQTITIDNIGAELTYCYSDTPGSSLSKDREYKIVPFSKMEDKYLTITTSEYTGNGEKLYNDYKDILTKYYDVNVVGYQSNI